MTEISPGGSNPIAASSIARDGRRALTPVSAPPRRATAENAHAETAAPTARALDGNTGGAALPRGSVVDLIA